MSENEKIYSELNTEDVLDSVSEDSDKTVAADNVDELTVAADADDNTENTFLADELSDTEFSVASAIGEKEETAKKKPPLQIPVLIACGIVLLAILGFLAYMAFFLKEPENITWAGDVEDLTYYYEFKTDGTFKAYLGSIEIDGSFQKMNSEEDKTITVDKNIGHFYQSMPVNYSISGSRLFGNQEMNCSYSEQYEFTLKQSKREKNIMDLPEDFTADEELLGTWIFKFMGTDIYRVTFNDNGSMTMEFIQDGIKYNGIYTLEDGKLNFTYYVNEAITTPLDYTVDGDYLTFLGYKFVREGSDAEKATSDQQMLFPQMDQSATADSQ